MIGLTLVLFLFNKRNLPSYDDIKTARSSKSSNYELNMAYRITEQEKLTENLSEKPAEKPSEKPTERPSEKPTEKSVLLPESRPDEKYLFTLPLKGMVFHQSSKMGDISSEFSSTVNISVVSVYVRTLVCLYTYNTNFIGVC